jgi:hypothetical protein
LTARETRLTVASSSAVQSPRAYSYPGARATS